MTRHAPAVGRVDGGHGDIGTVSHAVCQGEAPWRCGGALTKAARSPRWGKMGEVSMIKEWYIVKHRMNDIENEWHHHAVWR